MEPLPPQPANQDPPGVTGTLPPAPPLAETHPTLDTQEEFHPAVDTDEEFHPALDHETFDAVPNDQTETADISAPNPSQPSDPQQPLDGAQAIGLESAPSTVNGPAKGTAEASPARGTLEDIAMNDGFGGQEGELTDGGGVMVAESEQGVARGASGIGRPYAPATWQWKVLPSARVLTSGHYVDVVRKPPNGRDLKSIVQCKSYLKDELGLSDAEVEACLNTFEARIPASREVLLAEGVKTPTAETKSTSDGGAADEPGANGTIDEGMVITPQNVIPEEEDDEEEDEDTSTEFMLDEFLKSPENWGSIGRRLRGPQGKTQLKDLLETARSRAETAQQSLKRLKLRVLKFPVFLRSEELEALPQSLLTLVVLVMTEGAVYEAKSRRMLNAELVLIIREELTRHQRAHGLDAYGNEIKPREKKAKKVQVQDPGAGPGRKRKSRPSFEEESSAKRKRKSLNDISDKKETHKKEIQKKETHLVSRLVQLKPSLSGLSVEVDDDDPEEETVEQPVTPSRTPESATDALNAALEAAAGTPTGPHPAHAPSPPKAASPAFASPLFFANQALNEEVRTASGNAQGPPKEAVPTAEASASPMQSSPIPPPAPAPKPAPLTVEQLEIVHYRKKLVKLERKRRQWEKAFEQKLAAYRSKRETLESQLETRRAEQEAQKIRVVEETERLREARATALQELRALQTAADLPDVAEAELEKCASFEGIYTVPVDEVRKAKKKAWEEMKKGVNEVKRSNLEQMRKKVEAYRQLGLAVPQTEIEQEREQYSAEITEMQAKLEAQKVLLDAALTDLEQKTSGAKAAYDEYKARCKSLEKEEARLQRLLQERIA